MDPQMMCWMNIYTAVGVQLRLLEMDFNVTNTEGNIYMNHWYILQGSILYHVTNTDVNVTEKWNNVRIHVFHGNKDLMLAFNQAP